MGTDGREEGLWRARVLPLCFDGHFIRLFVVEVFLDEGLMAIRLRAARLRRGEVGAFDKIMDDNIISLM
jgi:hypothetical protein